MEFKKPCDTCEYGIKLSGQYCCEYILKEERMRPTNSHKECKKAKVYKRKAKERNVSKSSFVDDYCEYLLNMSNNDVEDVKSADNMQ